MDTIKIFFDVETTGVNYKKHSIHQLAGLIEINHKVVEEFDIKMAPHPKAEITPEALRICGVTKEQILAYQPFEAAHKQFKTLLGKYVDQYNKKQKAHLVGYNNRFFDGVFLRYWFELCGDNFYNSWFYGDTLDTMVLASQYLIKRRPSMPSFKLHRVATTLGIEVDKSKTHDALYDVHLTREIYQIVTGLEIEM